MGTLYLKGLGLTVAAMSLVLSACSSGSTAAAVIGPTNVAAKKGDLRVAVTATGSLSLPNKIDLTFGSAGTVTDVYVVEGERVVAGQKLAQLDPAALLLALTQVKTNVSVAQQNLDNLNDPANRASAVSTAAQTVARASSDFAAAEQALTDAQKPYLLGEIKTAENAHAAALQALQAAKDALAALAKDSALALALAQQTYQTYLVAVQNAQQSLDYALSSDTDPAIIALQATLESAKNSLDSATRAQAITQISNELAVKAAKDTVDTALSTALRYGAIFSNDNAYLRAVANQTIAESQAISATNKAQIDLKNANSSIVNAQAALAKALPSDAVVAQRRAALEAAKLTLNKAQDAAAKLLPGPDALELLTKQNGIVVAETNVKRAQDALDKVKVGADPVDIALKKAAVKFYTDNLKTAQNNLTKLAAGPDPVQLGQLQIALQKAQSELADAQQKFDQATLIAPFAGILDKVLIKKGHTTVANTVSPNSVAMTLVDPSIVEVTALVDEADVNQVRTGQAVQVTLQSAPAVPLTGTVKTIAYLGGSSQGVVSYTIKVSLAVPTAAAIAAAGSGRPGAGGGEGPAQGIGGGARARATAVADGTPLARAPGVAGAAGGQTRPTALFRDGMTATLRIVITQATGVVNVPVRAVTNSGGVRTVKVVKADATVEPRTVTVGISDGTNVEITSGLNEGETVQIPAAGASRSATGGGTFGGGGIRVGG